MSLSRPRRMTAFDALRPFPFGTLGLILWAKLLPLSPPKSQSAFPQKYVFEDPFHHLTYTAFLIETVVSHHFGYNLARACDVVFLNLIQLVTADLERYNVSSCTIIMKRFTGSPYVNGFAVFNRA